MKRQYENTKLIHQLKINGFESVAAFARFTKISQNVLGRMANLTYKVYRSTNKDDPTLCPHVLSVMDHLGLAGPEDMFPEDYLNRYQDVEHKFHGFSTQGQFDHIREFEQQFITDEFDPEEMVSNDTMTELVNKTLDSLTDREAKVLRMSFGIGMEDEMYDHEIGVTFDVTPMRIRQILNKALRKLRHPSRTEDLLPFTDPAILERSENQAKAYRERTKREKFNKRMKLFGEWLALTDDQKLKMFQQLYKDYPEADVNVSDYKHQNGEWIDEVNLDKLRTRYRNQQDYKTMMEQRLDTKEQKPEKRTISKESRVTVQKMADTKIKSAMARQYLRIATIDAVKRHMRIHLPEVLEVEYAFYEYSYSMTIKFNGDVDAKTSKAVSDHVMQRLQRYNLSPMEVELVRNEPKQVSPEEIRPSMLKHLVTIRGTDKPVRFVSSNPTQIVARFQY